MPALWIVVGLMLWLICRPNPFSAQAAFVVQGIRDPWLKKKLFPFLYRVDKGFLRMENVSPLLLVIILILIFVDLPLGVES